jgi:hypothetical protein
VTDAKDTSTSDGTSSTGGKAAAPKSSKTTDSSSAGKAARQAQAAKFQADLAAQERRRRLLFAGGVVALVAVIAIAVVIGIRGNSGSASADASSRPSGQQIPPAPVKGGTTTTQVKPESVAAPPVGIDGLAAWNTAGYPTPGTPGPGTLAHNHVDGPVVYAFSPPVGGEHSPIWLNAGVYTVPVPSERVVHNLEHGAVWITYRPSLTADQVAALTAFVAKQSVIEERGTNTPPGQGNRYIVMSPWASEDLPAPIVISSWGYQLQVQTPDDARLQKFVDTFRDNKTYSPEFGSPVDGIPEQTGGRPDSNGSTLANPAGAVQ